MSNTKTVETTVDTLADRAKSVASNFAMVTMAAATIIGMTELTDRHDVKVLAQPAFAYAGNSNFYQPGQDSAIRKEEVPHTHTSYGNAMRSEAASGKQ